MTRIKLLRPQNTDSIINKFSAVRGRLFANTAHRAVSIRSALLPGRQTVFYVVKQASFKFLFQLKREDNQNPKRILLKAK